MLDTLPSLPQSQFPKFISTLTPLATTNPTLFQPHLRPLLGFLPALILPSADPGPTPTVAKPFPTSGGSFTFPPPHPLTSDGCDGGVDGGGGGGGSSKLVGEDETDEDGMALDEEREDVRKAALEFMISLSEAKPAMVRKVDGWTAAIVRGCLEGMGEIGDDNLDVWLEADVRTQFSFFLFLFLFIYLHLFPPGQFYTARRRSDGRFLSTRIRTIDRPTSMRSRRKIRLTPCVPVYT